MALHCRWFIHLIFRAVTLLSKGSWSVLINIALFSTVTLNWLRQGLLDSRMEPWQFFRYPALTELRLGCVFKLLCETNILSRADGRVPARCAMTQCCARGEKGEHQVSAIIKSPAGPWARAWQMLKGICINTSNCGTNWNVSLKVSLERPVSVHLGHLPGNFQRLNELCHSLMSEWRWNQSSIWLIFFSRFLLPESYRRLLRHNYPHNNRCSLSLSLSHMRAYI